MGHSQAEKAQNRERILAEAARQMRSDGLESVSIGALMKSVGLTRGGFYGHFGSRSALLAQALERALVEGKAKATAPAAARPRGFAAIVRSYLSRAHRDERASGCAMAALVSDVARADEPSRGVMSEHIDAFVSAVTETLGGDEKRAIVAVSAMIGALSLSRVATDRARSDAFLKVVRDHLTMTADDDGQGVGGGPARAP